MCELKAGDRVMIDGKFFTICEDMGARKCKTEDLRRQAMRILDDIKKKKPVNLDWESIEDRFAESYELYEAEMAEKEIFKERFFGEKEEKKYTQAEMDEAMLKLEEVEIRAASYDRMFESREEMRNKVRALEDENEELKAQCKLLKMEKSIADINIARLEAQKQLLEYELSDLREGK